MIDSLIFSQQNSFAALEVGKHLYWQFGNLAVHAQVLIVSWIVMGVVIVAAIIGSSTAKADQRVPAGFQNFMEYALEYFQSIAKYHIGEKHY
ncbi:MAG: F0F1 ATP synthase subunit A, partial [Pseudanabaena sp.]